MSPVERLIRIRKILGLSQRELAEEFQVSTGAVGSWEVGQREIPGPVMKLIQIYETELKISSQPFRPLKPADELLEGFRKTIQLADVELLAKVREVIEGYLAEFNDGSSLGRDLEQMAIRPLIEALGGARGLPMKIAQSASLLSPKISMEMREIFETLQNHGRALPHRLVEKVFMEEFDRPTTQMFSEFCVKPVASASIGQVHRARLHDGTWVAVKIQNPDIQREISENFQSNEFVDQLSHFVRSQAIEIHELIQDLYETALNECNYEQEAEMQETYRTLFLNDPEIVVPRVHFTHSRRRVLTMDWGNGMSWCEFRRKSTQSERNSASKTITRFYATASFSHNLVHTDPHPGNYLFDAGKVIFLDFGRVRRLAPKNQKDFHSLHTILINDDREGAKKFMQNNSIFKVNEKFNFDFFWEIVSEIFQHLRKGSDNVFSKEQYSRHCTLLKQLGETGSFSISPDFFWAMVYTHSFILSGRADLDAAGNWTQIIHQSGLKS